MQAIQLLLLLLFFSVINSQNSCVSPSSNTDCIDCQNALCTWCVDNCLDTTVTTCTQPTTSCPQQSTSNYVFSQIGTIVGAIVGPLIFCAGCIIVICCLVCRRNARQRQAVTTVTMQTPSPVEEVTTVTTIHAPAPVATNNVYQQPGQPQIYAQPGQTIYSQPYGDPNYYPQAYGNTGVPYNQGGVYPSQAGVYPQGQGVYQQGQGVYPQGQGVYQQGQGVYQQGQGVYPQPGMAPPEQVYQPQTGVEPQEPEYQQV